MLGARVNVVGTVNVFEAVKQRLDRIPGVAYASSAAVYGPDDPSPAPESGGGGAPRPSTASTSSRTRAPRGSTGPTGACPSVGIRPYVVYGPGRDQGLTSGPTQAMAAAARGEGFEIGYGGVAQYDYAPAVGRAFVRAAAAPTGAVVANFPGVSASMAEVVAAIEAAAPEVAGGSWEDTPLPFPAEVESAALEEAIGHFSQPAALRASTRQSGCSITFA